MSNCTVLTNQSGGPLEVKEGTAGVWRNLKILKNNEVYNINVDPNATYCEYWCAVKENGPGELYISSVDCQECGSVIVQRQNGTYHLVKNRRNDTGNDAVQKANDAKTQDGFFAKAKKILISKLYKGSTSTKSTENQESGFFNDLK